MNPIRSPLHDTAPHDHAGPMTFRAVFDALPRAFGDVAGTDDFCVLNETALIRYDCASYTAKEGLVLIVHRPNERAPDEMIFEARLASYAINGDASAMEALLANLQQSAFTFNLCATVLGDISLQRPVSLWHLTPAQVEVEVSQFTKNCLTALFALAEVRSKNAETGFDLALRKVVNPLLSIGRAAQFPKAARVRIKHALALNSPRPSCPLPKSTRTGAPCRPSGRTFLGSTLKTAEETRRDACFSAFAKRLPALLDGDGPRSVNKGLDLVKATATGHGSFMTLEGVEVCVERNRRLDTDGEIYLHARLGNIAPSNGNFATIAWYVNQQNSGGRIGTLCWDDQHTLILRRRLDISSASSDETDTAILSFRNAIESIASDLPGWVMTFNANVAGYVGMGLATRERWINRPTPSLAEMITTYDARLDPASTAKPIKPISSYAAQRKICLYRLAHFAYDAPAPPPISLPSDSLLPPLFGGLIGLYSYFYPDPEVESDSIDADVDPAY